MPAFRASQSPAVLSARLSAWRSPAVTCLALGALLTLSACDSQPDAPAATSDASSESAYVSKGSFQCHAGKPWQKVQVTSTADVAPGATAKIIVETPPAIMPSLTGDKAFLFCQVDQTPCIGTSCHGNPPVDFIGEKGENGLTWESKESEGGNDRKITFTALAHNSDLKETHHVTLTLDLSTPN